MTEMWVACKFEPGGGAQMDRLPNKFHDVRFFDNELDALRSANTSGGKAFKVAAGATLDDLYLGRVKA